MKKICLLVLFVICSLFIVGCKETETGTYSARPTKAPTSEITFEPGEKPQVEIILSNSKSIKLELYPDIAPITVKNFLTLVQAEFYDGLVFHRVIKNFMIQGGGYEYTGHGTSSKKIVEKEAETIVGEFSSNGHTNDLKHTPGVISMARANDYNSASSQFFICVADYSSGDGKYAAFGKTIDEDSLNNAIEISKKPTSSVTISGTKFDDFPDEPIYIRTIRRIDK